MQSFIQLLKKDEKKLESFIGPIDKKSRKLNDHIATKILQSEHYQKALEKLENIPDYSSNAHQDKWRLTNAFDRVSWLHFGGHPTEGPIKKSEFTRDKKP